MELKASVELLLEREVVERSVPQVAIAGEERQAEREGPPAAAWPSWIGRKAGNLPPWPPRRSWRPHGAWKAGGGREAGAGELGASGRISNGARQGRA